MPDTRKIEIKFGGDLHEINVDLLVESLVSYSLVTQEAAAYIAPGSVVNIKVKAPQEGSFTIILDLITENAPSLFTRENLQLAANLVVVVGGLYGLKKWLSTKGKPEIIKEKGDDNIEIQNKNGSIVIAKRVYNIYQNSINTRENLRKTFTKLKEEEEISNFSISDIDGNKQIFYVDKDDFEKIEKGEVAFRSGDRLIVNLEIEQVFNEAANTFVNDSYRITKVIQHIPRTGIEQQNLNFEK